MTVYPSPKSPLDMVTNRQTNRSSEASPKAPETWEKTKNKGNDDSRFCGNLLPSVPGSGSTSHRISKQALLRLDHRLTERDLAILTSLHSCQYFNSGQVKRLHVTEATSDKAALRATNRNLKKLKEMGLVVPLEQQIGGSRGGSSSFIWHLTEAGVKLLHLHGGDTQLPRKRFLEPSLTHVNHTLAIAECYVCLVELCRFHPQLRLASTEFEPICWRSFSYRNRPLSVKPDLFAITESGDYEDRWFIEIDLATEALPVIVRKCERYLRYYQTGKEQKQQGVFPVVLWVVPDQQRRRTMVDSIQTQFCRGSPRIFAVITPEQMQGLFLNGLQEGDLC